MVTDDILHNKGENLKQQIEREMMLSLMVKSHRLATPVSQIRDVVTFRNMTPAPLSPKEVLGVINVRGHVVTIIDCDSLLSEFPIRVPTSLKTKDVKATHPSSDASPPKGVDSLALNECADSEAHAQDYSMCVTFEHDNDLYAIAVDKADDLFLIGEDERHPMPATLPPIWQQVGACMVPYGNDLIAQISLHEVVKFIANRQPQDKAHAALSSD